MAIKKLLFKKVKDSFESLPFKAESANGALTLNFKSKDISCPFSIYWSIDKTYWSPLNTGLAQGIGSMLLSNLPKDLWLKISSRHEIFEGLFLDEGTSEPEAVITINGTVSPKEASLVFTSSDLGSFEAATDAEGKYSIDLPEGEYTYSCELEGYTTQSDTVNATKQLDLTLEKEKITVSGTITPFTAVLTIIPLAGGDSIKPTISSSNGSYSQQLDKGSYIYTVEAENYIAQKGSVSETKDLTVSLEKEHMLFRGRVTPHKATVSFTPVSGGESFNAYVNPVDGMFVIDLPKDSYNYSVSADGYEQASGVAEPSTEFIEVNLNRETITVSGTLSPASSVIIFKSKGGAIFTPAVDPEAGTYSQVLPKESFDYSVKAEGYISQNGTVDSTKTLNITLKTTEITITGTVKPFTASLTFTKEGESPIKAAVNTKDGSFTQVLPRDTYTYSAENAGYISKTGSVSETGPLNITLQTSEITISGTVTPATAALSFTKKSGGEPVVVSVTPETGAYSQVLPRDTYMYNATNDGYTPKSGEVKETQTLNISLDPVAVPSSAKLDLGGVRK